MFAIRNNKGVTLIEVNLAMGVLLFGIISVFSLFPTWLRLAEEGFRQSDAAFIGEMARAKLEFLINAGVFVFPENFESDVGRFAADAPPTGQIQSHLECIKLDSDDKPNWPTSPQIWKDARLEITSGAETGRLLELRGNTADRLYFATSSPIAGLKIRRGDSFRIVKIVSSGSMPATECIPSDFYTAGSTIPTIVALEFDRIRGKTGQEHRTLDDYRPSNAEKLSAMKGSGGPRYSYAIILAGRDPDSPDLYTADVQIFKDHKDVKPGDSEYVPASVRYTFYYRKGLLFER